MSDGGGRGIAGAGGVAAASILCSTDVLATGSAVDMVDVVAVQSVGWAR